MTTTSTAPRLEVSYDEVRYDGLGAYYRIYSDCGAIEGVKVDREVKAARIVAEHGAACPRGCVAVGLPAAGSL